VEYLTRLEHEEMVSSVHGCSGWQRIATNIMEMKAHDTDVHIVPQIAKEWPNPGVKRRNRKAVEHFEANRVTI